MLYDDLEARLTSTGMIIRTMMWVGFGCTVVLVGYYTATILTFRSKMIDYFYRLFYVKKAEIAGAYLHLLDMDQFWQLLLTDQWQCFRKRQAVYIKKFKNYQQLTEDR